MATGRAVVGGVVLLMVALRAWLSGAWRALRAPALVLGIYVMVLAITVPLGTMLHVSLPAPGIRVSPATEEPVPPDPDWLDEVATEGRGLVRTLTPAVIGVAAPLDNFNAILDRTGWPVPVLGAAAVFFVCWMAIWGGVIARLGAGRRLGLRGFVVASRRAAPAVLALGLIALGAYLMVFVTVYPVMFGPLYDWLKDGELERTAFLWRAALTVVFGAGLVAASQILDFARLAAVMDGLGARAAIARGVADVRRQPVAIAGLAIINSLLFAGLVVAYGAVEFVPGGSVPNLTRIVVVGQAYIVARLVLRLVLVAAQINLRQTVDSQRLP